MQLRPQPWTHHHVHRLYHLSLGICFGFAAFVMVAGMATFWMQAGAYELSDSGAVSISATVAGINPGPTSSGSGPKPVQTKNLSVTIQAEPLGQITSTTIGSGNQAVSAYVFNSVRPSFSGTTSVSNGIVFIHIDGPVIINSTARATANGYWSWQSSDALPVGTYLITVSVFDSYDLTRSANAKAYYLIEIPEQPIDPGQPSQPGQPGMPGTPGQPTQSGTPSAPPTSEGPPAIPPSEVSSNLFGVFFQIQTQYKTTEVGQKVVAWVTLVSNTDAELRNQDVRYTVTSPQGKIILDTTDTVSFSKQLQYMKSFNIAPQTPTGMYTVRVSSTYNGIESVVTDTFTLKQPLASVGVSQQGPAVIWSLLILLFLLFLVLVIIAYRYVRHHTKALNANPATIV